MADIKNPYKRNWSQYDYIKTRYLEFGDEKPLPLSTDEATLENTVWITNEGKVIANGFIDQSAALDFYVKDKDTVRFSLYKDLNGDKVFDLVTEPTYVFSGYVTSEITEGFKLYRNSLTDYDRTTQPGYSRLSRYSKRSVDSQVAGERKFNFHFTGTNGENLATPYMEGTWFQPFNVDVGIRPQTLLNNVKNLLVIKTGEFYQLPRSPSEAMVSVLQYSSGTSGNLYVHTHSLPDPEYLAFYGADSTVKHAKIPRQTNSGVDDMYTGQATPSIPTPFGPVGLASNGVFFVGYKYDESYLGQGVWHNNWYEKRFAHLDRGNGDVSEKNVTSGHLPEGSYHIKAAPFRLYDTGNSTSHSPLVGFAFDGSPIYGPYAYSGTTGQSNTVKRMEPSYRHKPFASRPNGPEYTGLFGVPSEYPSGCFVEDFEYIQGLGDLDDHNGRFCRTPDYPTGVFAYFTTVDEVHDPQFPYIIGDTFYGNVEMKNYDGDYAGGSAEVVKVKYGDVGEFDVDLWAIYGEKYKESVGLKKETVVFVSPHELRSKEGVFLTTGKLTGLRPDGAPATYSGVVYNATGGHKFLGSTKTFQYPSSHLNTFGAGAAFSGGMSYTRTDPDTKTSQELTAPTSVTGTSFYAAYSGYKTYKNGETFADRVYSGHWDGVIPAGTPFKIETWSFDGVWNGFENACLIYPISGHESVSGKTIFMQKICYGEGEDQVSAYEDMTNQANLEFRKNMDSYLVNSGVINLSRNMKKFKKLMLNSTLEG